MKLSRLFKKSGYIFVIFLIIVAISPLLFISHPVSGIDAVTTLAATTTSITTTSAELNAILNSCWQEMIWVSFEYGLTDSCELGTTTEQAVVGWGPFSKVLTGLNPGTTYYFRAKADDHLPDTVHYGAVMSFTTLPAPSSIASDNWYWHPSVVTIGSSNITDSSATVSGNLTSMGTARKVLAYFKYGTHYYQTVWPLWAGGNVTLPHVFKSPGDISANITNLNPGTTYYFRAVASGEGTIYGAVMTFITPSPAKE